MSSWAFCWTALYHSHVPSHRWPGRRDHRFPLRFLCSGCCREQWGCLLTSSSPGWTAQASSASLCRTCLQALFPSSLALLWMMHSSTFFYCGAQNCTQYSKWGHDDVKYRGRITSLAGCAVFHAPQGAICPLGSRACCWLVLVPALTSTSRSTSAELLQPLISQSVPVSTIIPSLMQHPAFSHVELPVVAPCLVPQSI